MTLKIGDNLTVYDMDEIDGIPYHLLVDNDGNFYDLMTRGDQDLTRESGNIIQLLDSLLHQLSTDSDLETVTAAVHYAKFVEDIKSLLYRLDPTNGQLQHYFPEIDA